MYRPHKPYLTVPPVAHRDLRYEPEPRQSRTSDSFQSKDARTAGQCQSLTAPAFKPSDPDINRWKSSFRRIEENDTETKSDNDSSPDRKRLCLYDPFESSPSESFDEPAPAPPQESSKPRSRWDVDDTQKQRRIKANPEASRFPVPQTDSVYSSVRGKDEHKDTDYRPEGTPAKDLATTGVRLSPPPPLHNFKQTPGCSGPEQVPPPKPEAKAQSPERNALSVKDLISCDLCEVEVSNGQELEEHLDSKAHWDTLEHIQKHNNYDDMAIAFLQDLMLYKSRRSSRAMEDNALQALQEYDHMTRVEMFHCAACGAFVPTSALAVQSHVSTQEHMSNAKKFEAQQRRVCLEKAATMMKALTPQFMLFAKGASPFE